MVTPWKAGTTSTLKPPTSTTSCGFTATICASGTTSSTNPNERLGEDDRGRGRALEESGEEGEVEVVEVLVA